MTVSCVGPVVYLNAEAGERAQQVFHYILERAVDFVNDLRPAEAQPVRRTRAPPVFGVGFSFV